MILTNLSQIFISKIFNKKNDRNCIFIGRNVEEQPLWLSWKYSRTSFWHDISKKITFAKDHKQKNFHHYASHSFDTDVNKEYEFWKMNIWRNSHSLSPQLKQLNSCANCMIWTICNHKINLLRRSFALKFQTHVIGSIQRGLEYFCRLDGCIFPALKTILRQRLRS